MRHAITLLAWYFAVVAPGAPMVSVVGPFATERECGVERKMLLMLTAEAALLATGTHPLNVSLSDLDRVRPCWSSEAPPMRVR